MTDFSRYMMDPRRQGLLGAAQALAQAGQYSTIPRSMGSAIAGAAAGFQQGQFGALQKNMGLENAQQKLSAMHLASALAAQKNSALSALAQRLGLDPGTPENIIQGEMTNRANIAAGKGKTPQEKNAEAMGFIPGTEEYKKYITDATRRKGTSVSVGGPKVDLPGTEPAFLKELGKLNAQNFMDKGKKASDAAASLRATAAAEKLINDGVITGFGSNTVMAFGKALQKIGVHFADDPISNTEAFAASRAQEVGRIIKLFGAGTGLSDADRAYAEKAAAGDITMNEASIKKILDINKRVSMKIMKNYNSMALKIPKKVSPFPLTIDIPKFHESPIGGVDTNATAPDGITFLGFE